MRFAIGYSAPPPLAPLPPPAPWRRKWPPLQHSCLENPMDGGAWWAAVHGVAKSQTRLSGFTFTFHFPALEKEMATHSSVLAWRIPGTGEPHGLPSMGLHSQTQLKRLSSSSSIFLILKSIIYVLVWHLESKNWL